MKRHSGLQTILLKHNLLHLYRVFKEAHAHYQRFGCFIFNNIGLFEIPLEPYTYQGCMGIPFNKNLNELLIESSKILGFDQIMSCQ